LIYLPDRRPVAYDHIVQSIDIIPTLLEAVGIVKQDGMQGSSLLNDFATNRRKNQFAFSCIGYGHRLRMIRTYNHKYWILNDNEVLFDIINDPSEVNNLFNICKDTVSQMRKMLLNAIIAAEDPLPRPRV
jgi:arylsulfatase A-like enzyme